MRPPRLVLGTVRQIWNWLAPLLAVSDADIVRCAGFDALVLTRVLLIGLQMFTVMTILGVLVLIPYYKTSGGTTEDADAGAGKGTTSRLAAITISHLPNGSSKLLLPFFFTYIFAVYGCAVLWINCRCYTRLRLAYFLCLDALPPEAVLEAGRKQAPGPAGEPPGKQGPSTAASVTSAGPGSGVKPGFRKPAGNDFRAVVAAATKAAAPIGAGAGGAGAGVPGAGWSGAAKPTGKPVAEQPRPAGAGARPPQTKGPAPAPAMPAGADAPTAAAAPSSKATLQPLPGPAKRSHANVSRAAGEALVGGPTPPVPDMPEQQPAAPHRRRQRLGTAPAGDTDGPTSVPATQPRRSEPGGPGPRPGPGPVAEATELGWEDSAWAPDDGHWRRARALREDGGACGALHRGAGPVAEATEPGYYGGGGAGPGAGDRGDGGSHRESHGGGAHGHREGRTGHGGGWHGSQEHATHRHSRPHSQSHSHLHPHGTHAGGPSSGAGPSHGPTSGHDARHHTNAGRMSQGGGHAGRSVATADQQTTGYSRGRASGHDRGYGESSQRSLAASQGGPSAESSYRSVEGYGDAAGPGPGLGQGPGSGLRPRSRDAHSPALRRPEAPSQAGRASSPGTRPTHGQGPHGASAWGPDPRSRPDPGAVFAADGPGLGALSASAEVPRHRPSSSSGAAGTAPSRRPRERMGLPHLSRPASPTPLAQAPSFGRGSDPGIRTMPSAEQGRASPMPRRASRLAEQRSSEAGVAPAQGQGAGLEMRRSSNLGPLAPEPPRLPGRGPSGSGAASAAPPPGGLAPPALRPGRRLSEQPTLDFASGGYAAAAAAALGGGAAFDEARPGSSSSLAAWPTLLSSTAGGEGSTRGGGGDRGLAGAASSDRRLAASGPSGAAAADGVTETPLAAWPTLMGGGAAAQVSVPIAAWALLPGGGGAGTGAGNAGGWTGSGVGGGVAAQPSVVPPLAAWCTLTSEAGGAGVLPSAADIGGGGGGSEGGVVQPGASVGPALAAWPTLVYNNPLHGLERLESRDARPHVAIEDMLQAGGETERDRERTQAQAQAQLAEPQPQPQAAPGPGPVLGGEHQSAQLSGVQSGRGESGGGYDARATFATPPPRARLEEHGVPKAQLTASAQDNMTASKDSAQSERPRKRLPKAGKLTDSSPPPEPSHTAAQPDPATPLYAAAGMGLGGAESGGDIACLRVARLSRTAEAGPDSLAGVPAFSPAPAPAVVVGVEQVPPLLRVSRSAEMAGGAGKAGGDVEAGARAGAEEPQLPLQPRHEAPEMPLTSIWLNLSNFLNPALRMMLDYLDWMGPLQLTAGLYGVRNLRLPVRQFDQAPPYARLYGADEDMVGWDDQAQAEINAAAAEAAVEAAAAKAAAEIKADTSAKGTTLGPIAEGVETEYLRGAGSAGAASTDSADIEAGWSAELGQEGRRPAARPPVAGGWRAWERGFPAVLPYWRPAKVLAFLRSGTAAVSRKGQSLAEFGSQGSAPMPRPVSAATPTRRKDQPYRRPVALGAAVPQGGSVAFASGLGWLGGWGSGSGSGSGGGGDSGASAAVVGESAPFHTHPYLRHPTRRRGTPTPTHDWGHKLGSADAASSTTADGGRGADVCEAACRARELLGNPHQPLLPGKNNVRLLQMLQVPVSVPNESRHGGGSGGLGGVSAQEPVVRLVNARHYTVLIRAVRIQHGPGVIDRWAALSYLIVKGINVGASRLAGSAASAAAAATTNPLVAHRMAGAADASTASGTSSSTTPAAAKAAPKRGGPGARRRRSRMAGTEAGAWESAMDVLYSRTMPNIRRYYAMFHPVDGDVEAVYHPDVPAAAARGSNWAALWEAISDASTRPSTPADASVGAKGASPSSSISASSGAAASPASAGLRPASGVGGPSRGAPAGGGRPLAEAAEDRQTAGVWPHAEPGGSPSGGPQAVGHTGRRQPGPVAEAVESPGRSPKSPKAVRFTDLAAEPEADGAALEASGTNATPFSSAAGAFAAAAAAAAALGDDEAPATAAINTGPVRRWRQRKRMASTPSISATADAKPSLTTATTTKLKQLMTLETVQVNWAAMKEAKEEARELENEEPDKDHNGRAVSNVLRELFPTSFLGLVPISDTEAVEKLIGEWDTATMNLAEAVRQLRMAESSSADLRGSHMGSKAGAERKSGDLEAGPGGDGSDRGSDGGSGGAAAGGGCCTCCACCCCADGSKTGTDGRRGGDTAKAAAEAQKARERILELRARVKELEGHIEAARAEALANPVGTAYFALFNSSQDAQMLAQCQRVLPPRGPGSLVSFDAVPAPAPDDVCWPSLLSSTAGEQFWRRVAIFVPMGVLFALPIGAAQGALANLDVALCGGSNDQTDSGSSGGGHIYVSWFCNPENKLVQHLIVGVLPSLIALVWSTLVIPVWLYVCSSISRKQVSLSGMEREMQTWFFWYSLFNTFLGAVLGAGFLRKLGTYLQDPESIFNEIGQSLPNTANFFIQFVIARGLFVNVLRLLWPHAGVMLGSLFRGLLRIGVPRSLHDAAVTHMVPSARAANFYNGILQVMMFGFAFAIVSPLILPCCWFFFLTGFFAYRYCMLYTYERSYESGGRMWPVLFGQIMGFMIIMEVFTGAALMVMDEWVLAAIMWATLTPPLILFWRFCHRRYLEPLQYAPLSLVAREPVGAAVDPLVYTPPALRPGAVGWYPQQGKVWEKYFLPKQMW
ncbi:hypothetical protein HYH03_012104 [Edaphochlamys debaryana]|uniref:Uncharacterized protein n=1 Tax=Edaphochlamys debaryana TaxID=47281 RepID=A0A835XSK7_9CHLO|nr:hypothetical protein HYH03_012104 [Edaphochlamys debaryana]|eukprot:KAG2489468.1 hypothetical protein HYH03_012104 [Edaphochlamys debaryana]